MSDVLSLARRVRDEMPENKDVTEFVSLVERAAALMNP
jgi:hypothetical protein